MKSRGFCGSFDLLRKSYLLFFLGFILFYYNQFILLFLYCLFLGIAIFRFFQVETENISLQSEHHKKQHDILVFILKWPLRIFASIILLYTSRHFVDWHRFIEPSQYETKNNTRLIDDSTKASTVPQKPKSEPIISTGLPTEHTEQYDKEEQGGQPAEKVIFTAKVIAHELNVRSDPDPNSITNIVNKIYIGDLVDVYRIENGWAYIGSGWVNVKLLKKPEEASESESDTDDGQDNSSKNNAEIAATVSSPNDGFLALRSKPSIETGVRLYKIPHGTELVLYKCNLQVSYIDQIAGHWCRTSYQGQTGWVFDGYLVQNSQNSVEPLF